MEYVKTLVAAASLYAVAAALAPEREGVRRATMIAFSVLFMVAILPHGSLPSLDPSLWFPDEEEVNEEDYAAYLKEATEKSIATELGERFSVGDGDLRVSSDFSYANGRVTVTRLTVMLTPTGFLADVPSLVRYVEEYYEMECEVIALDA